MTTGTSHRFTTERLVVEGHAPRRGRIALAVGVIVVAVLSVAAAVAYAYEFTEEYGGGTGIDGLPVWLPMLALAVVPGLLLAWAVQLGAEVLAGRGRPRYVRLAPVSVALVAVVVAGAALVGSQVHDTNAAVASRACSTQDVAVLDQLLRYAPDSNPAAGQSDGTCRAWLVYPGEDGQAVMATLTAELTADGWTTTDTAWDARTFARGGEAVLVEHDRSSEGTTAIGLTALDR
jgi:hypothetical protein